ncbi:hypothetical protein GUITHDRAFT_100683 [Guillardia theta CCMP2712]|uniref:RBR-type E3 ubiquitin transferase n=1 Tax=Guillardia theta (strain CCMP2712) TaxID=905079 RepID=L1JYQ7_GUITC|nr:hypothetical protein GUITHDRAFT_100683 [Guillardia theta CCMP2712]EKX53711.1 hypothetical protein GUITHDRAFT_100683 [Guillardia theta CCMP2712]|eukprot:XP_005840691.1 hypothetical protein GUITHDRAFT_100683 [Guillardia theta CCMP2712]
MFHLHVSEGSIDLLICPKGDCRIPIAPYVVKDITNQELYNRFQTMFHKKSLEKITGLRFCPRCASLDQIEAHSAGTEEGAFEPVPCVPETAGDFNLYICPKCSFTFCGKCFRAYHPGVSCESREFQQVLDLSNPRLQQSMQERLATQRLIQQSTGARADARAQAVGFYRNRLGRAMVNDPRAVPCPNCREQIMKRGTNNHITCNNCSIQFCFLCRVRLKKMAGHFNPSHPQHSDVQDT